MPGVEDDDDDRDDVEPDEGGAEPGGDDDSIVAHDKKTGDVQRLVRHPRRRPRGGAPPAAAPVDPPPPPVVLSGGAQPAPAPPAPPTVTPQAPNPPAPVAPTMTSAATASDGNVFFAFEETVKMNPAAAQSIAVERRTGTPAHWMIVDRPRTANELYAAIKRLHGRSPETTYAVTFRDAGGRGSVGLVSMPSTLDEPPPQGAPVNPYPYPQQQQQPPYAQPAPYAPPYAQVLPPQVAAPTAPPGAPFDATALLTMQRQLFEMMQSMQGPRSAAAMPAAIPQAPPAPQQPDVNALLAMQKQMFDMMQSMQAPPGGHTAQPPVAAPQPVHVAPPAQDQAGALLAMQKQMFEMMQAMLQTASGHQPAPQAPAPVVAPAATDSTSAMLAMQKQMFEMMMTMMQTAQRGATPPAAGPFQRPQYGGVGVGDPRDPRAPYQPPARPQTPSEQLRDAVSVVRSTLQVAREFSGPPAAEQQAPEEDDSPVRVIDMGRAKGVINRNDGSLRGLETLMANLPDIISGTFDKYAELRKAADERKQKQPRVQLAPGYVEVTADYQPPPGFVAVPVDQIPAEATQAQDALPEPPDEMPPPIAASESARPTPAWGMPPGRS